MHENSLKYIEVLDDDFHYFETGISDLDLERHYRFDETVENEEERFRVFEKKRRLLRRAYKLSTECLTDRQLQIFLMRFKLEMRVCQIAAYLGISEAYVSSTVKTVLAKLRKGVAKEEILEVTTDIMEPTDLEVSITINEEIIE